MIAVIFEVTPAPGQTENYLSHAASLRPLLDEIPGFVSVERFQSLTDPSKLLSISFFENEAALTAWRNTTQHRATQSAGRDGIFSDYRIRIGQVLRDYGLNDREQAPADSRIHHASQTEGPT